MGGDWTPFWHDLIDMFGMESLFIKMCTEPELVHATLEHIMDYYLKANRRIFEEAADLFDIFFIGNDFGSAIGPLIGESQFREFISPHLMDLVDLGKSYNLKIMLHCCGGFRELIPAMIETGLDAIHAIQPNCNGMEIKALKAEFGDKIVFNGCIDSQNVLIDGDKALVMEKTKETLEIMMPGSGYIGGSSHDYILEETPVENIVTMFDTIEEFGRYC